MALKIYLTLQNMFCTEIRRSLAKTKEKKTERSDAEPNPFEYPKETPRYLLSRTIDVDELSEWTIDEPVRRLKSNHRYQAVGNLSRS